MRELIFLLLLSPFVMFACKDEGKPNTSYVPDVPVNLTVNTDLPLYYHLQNPGNFVLLEGGYRGVFLIHHYDDNFYAIERTCSFEADKTCSVIHYDTSVIQLRCGTYVDKKFQTCCTSQFSLEGFVIQGPAMLPLKQYQVFKNGSLLTIRN